MFADSSNVFSIQYVARGLRECNIITGSFMQKSRNMNVKRICY